jgi:cysteine desulfurase/selenocysteine lyase
VTDLVSATSASPAATPIDVRSERARTLAGQRIAPMGHHLNAAGASLPTAEVVQAVVDHLRQEAEIGGYEAATLQLPRLEAVYSAAAALLGAQAADIALVESATVGWRRLVESLRLAPGDRVVATRSTYVSSALHLLELERTGVVVEVADDDADGRTDLDGLRRLLSRPTALLAATHIPTSSGTVQPAAEIGELAAAAGVPYLLDATQSIGQLPVDVSAIGCDALVTTGRKFLRAPRGTGLLYVAPALRGRLRPTAPDVRGAVWSADHDFDLQSSARRFESWEAAHALRLGLGVAFAEVIALGVDRVQAHVVDLACELRARLTDEVRGIRIGEPVNAGSGIVTFVCEDETPQQTLARLTRADCHAVVVPASHGRWDMAPRGLEAVIRASFHVYNDSDDVSAVRAARRGEPRSARPAPTEPESGSESAPASFRTSRPRDGADVIVVGAGIHGRSVAWQLARRGASVLMLERLRPGHRQGSSHGATRMIRRAYPSTAWDGLVDRAYAAWAELEAAADAPLITVTGGLFAHPEGEPGGLSGPGCELTDVLTARAIAPALELGAEYVVVHDPAAGVIDARDAMTTLAAAGHALGVRLRDSSPVLGLAEDEHGVDVITPGQTLRAAHVVVCAGPWTGTVIPELAPALSVQRIVNVHLHSQDPVAVGAPALGVFSVAFDGRLLYGIPGVGGDALKVGFDDGPTDDPSLPAAPVTAAEVQALRAAVRRFLPRGDGEPEATIACRYTVTPTRRFAVGALADRPRVLVAAACSGHGFKFGPAIGDALADLVGGIARPDLAFLDPAALIGAPVG